MTAATGISSQPGSRPGLRVRTAAVAMTATFAVGLIAGLAAPLAGGPVAPAQIRVVDRAAVDAGVAASAYQDYRRGEREALFPSPADVTRAWQTYRAGERGDAPTP